MNIGAVIEKMIDFYDGSLRDINHFLKVYAFAKAIGEVEGLEPEAQRILELAAVVHDISCPLCREKYGSVAGKHQEAEGPALVRTFFADLPIAPRALERVCELVGRHHTYEDVDGPDCQILLEADFLVNAHEGALSEDAVRAMMERVFKTAAGTRMLRSAYKL